jgi:hypothetical protein
VNEICRSPPGGVNSFTWPKLTTANDKVKFMDGGFFTLVLTFFLIIFYPRIVDSEFCCMFTPSQRSDTKNTTIMKKQYTTFENIGYSVVLLAMFFIGSFAILSVYKLLSIILGVDA